jgi:hypothetical protein
MKLTPQNPTPGIKPKEPITHADIVDAMAHILAACERQGRPGPSGQGADPVIAAWTKIHDLRSRL